MIYNNFLINSFLAVALRFMSRSAILQTKAWLSLYMRLFGRQAQRGGRSHETEDALQDVALQLLESGDAAIRDQAAYLRRAVSNRVISQHRAQAVRRAEPLHMLDEAQHPHCDGADAHYQADQTAAALLAALQELPDACQTAFRLRQLEGLSNDDIAARLGVSRNMVERHMMRTMRHLQDRLQQLS